MSQKNENNEKNLNQESSAADNKPKVIIKKIMHLITIMMIIKLQQLLRK